MRSLWYQGSDWYCYQESYRVWRLVCTMDGGVSARAGWQRWLHWAGPLLTSGCLSSLCKNAVLCLPIWHLPVLALSTTTPVWWSPLRSVRGSPSRQPSECACHRPEPGGNNEPGPPTNKINDIYFKASLFQTYILQTRQDCSIITLRIILASW